MQLDLMILHAPSKLEGELILSVACDTIRRFSKLRTAKSSNHHLKPNYIYTYDRFANQCANLNIFKSKLKTYLFMKSYEKH